jgi:hypothetical protein
MKLYTENQVRNAIQHATFSENIRLESIAIDFLRPIELPSDEEIDKAMFPLMDPLVKDGFIEGAKWMRDKLTSSTKEI